MPPPPDHTVAVQHSRLLTIPGEIRNLIFEFTIEKALSKTRPKFIDVKEQPDSIRLTRKPGCEQDWSKLLRVSVGLTQTCRQLRQEFLPIHQACVTIRVTMEELPEYTVTFIDGLDVANISVWLPSGRRPHCYTDISELISLCERGPAIKLRLDILGNPALRELFFDPLEHPDIFAYMKSKVKYIRLRWGGPFLKKHGRTWRTTSRVFMVMKQESSEQWMIDRVASDLQSWRHKLKIHGMNIVPLPYFTP